MSLWSDMVVTMRGINYCGPLVAWLFWQVAGPWCPCGPTQIHAVACRSDSWIDARLDGPHRAEL
jgi:hypothetical protein